MRFWYSRMEGKVYLTVLRLSGINTRHFNNTTHCRRQLGHEFVYGRADLRSDYFRKKDYQRALCEDPEIIQKWFNLVRNVVTKYGVVDDDVWNFDETGFQMGVISTARVVTGTERRGKPVVTQP